MHRNPRKVQAAVAAAVEPELHPSTGDFNKGVFDYLKHIATLATGSILTITTLLQSVFKQPVRTELVPIAIALFLGCIASSLLAFGVMLFTYPRPGFLKRTEAAKNVISTGIVATWFTFLGGIIALAVFFIANWNALYAK